MKGTGWKGDCEVFDLMLCHSKRTRRQGYLLEPGEEDSRQLIRDT